MTPGNIRGKLDHLFFIHGGVWIVGDFRSQHRLLRAPLSVQVGRLASTRL